MSFEPGTRLGPYEIVSRLGQGGMGEVYLARDPRLGRDVAIKTSNEQFSERFEREARAVAALNHPNICTLFDVGPNYLVMELIEGPTLADRIKDGAIPLEEALGIARQISDALEAAHDKGIVHRDLKPANIKIQSDGRVKVLDFGLAKLAEPATAASGENSPTLTLGTQAGVILGTAAYMSPEQARGKTVDKRADIWAFGVVLYEMLTAEKVFGGETISDMLAAVLTRELDLNKVPFEVRRMLRSCLEREPKKRLRDIGDAWKLLDEAPKAIAAEVAPVQKKTPWIWPAAAALLALAGGALAYLHFSEAAPQADTMRFRVTLPPSLSFVNTGMLAMSPDGRSIVFPALSRDGVRGLWLHSFDALESRKLDVEIPPVMVVFWSPDSRTLVVNDSNGRIRKIDLAGGAAQTLAEIPGLLAGGSWSPNGTLLIGSDRGILRLPAAGGTPEPITQIDTARKENIHAYPVFLPDGERFLYLRSGTGSTGLAMGSIAKPPAGQSTKTILDYQFAPVFVAKGKGGQLLFMREGTLVAQDLDIDGEQLTGSPKLIAESVGITAQGFPLAAASANGRLVYRTGTGANQILELTWYDRKGNATGKLGDPARISMVALAPDASRVAIAIPDKAAKNDIWLVDTKDGATSRFTFGPENDTLPVWSPDSSRIAFRSDREKSGIYIKAASGAGGEEHFFDFDSGANITEWTRDGRYILYQSLSAARESLDEWIVPLEGNREPVAIVHSKANEVAGRFSPDGRYIAYRSNLNNNLEIYVQEVKLDGSTGGQWMISNGGAAGMIRWRADGRELLYLASDGNIMAVDISTTPVFRAGTPHALFQIPLIFLRSTSTPGTLADMTRDAQKFLFAMPAVGQEALDVVLNWDAAAK